MPGIVGIIGKNRRPESANALRQMLDSLLHEPRFSSGTLSIEKAQANLGWVCHPGSFADCLPVWNEARSICLIFAGEVFPERAELEALGQKGHQFDYGNASYLVHLYEEMGIGFLLELNGCFSGVLVDLRDEKVVLFNDRYGLSRVYCHEDQNAFYFASEAKALIKIVPALGTLDPTALAEFFLCGCPLQNRSLFSGIRILPGASEWTWRSGQKLPSRVYFDHSEWEKQDILGLDAFFERLSEVFTRIVPRYFSSPQAIGMSITGGLDSRMIMAAMRPAADTLKCYTFGGMYRDSADVKVGRALARACGQVHQVLPLSPDFFAEFSKLSMEAVRLTDGAMDVTGAASLYLNRLARNIAPVRMTGNYGGEILRGITGIKTQPLDESLFDPGFVPQLRRVPHTLEQARQSALPTFIAFKQVPWHHYAMFAVEQSQLTVRTPYLDNELVALSYQAPPQFRRNKNLAFRYVAETAPRLASLPNDRGTVWKPCVDLDRQRTRLRAWREEFRPRAEYLFDYGMPDWLARIDRLFSPLHLERLFLGNQKFNHFRIWYRRELSGFVQELLLDDRTLGRPLWNRHHVERVVSEHLGGTANHTQTIHKLLTYELLHRTLLEQT